MHSSGTTNGRTQEHINRGTMFTVGVWSNEPLPSKIKSMMVIFISHLANFEMAAWMT